MENPHEAWSSPGSYPAPSVAQLFDDEIEEALRIQAAAVAAQQAALNEEEYQLAQRRAALEQQEAQVAAHLENKRRRLVEVRDQCQEARRLLHEDRQEQDRRLAQARLELEQRRAALDAELDGVANQRRRLGQLGKRLRKRFHRHWLAERQKLNQEMALLNQQEAEVIRQRNDLEANRCRAQDERRQSKRRLEEQWQTFHQQRRQWEQSVGRHQESMAKAAQAIEKRQMELRHAEEQLRSEQASWQPRKQALQAEAEGLERRIENARQVLSLMEQRIAPLERSCQPDDKIESAPPVEAGRARHVSRFLAAIAGLQCQLHDQRVQLAEQFQRLLGAENACQQDHLGMLRELEAIGGRLAARELAVAQKEKALRDREFEALHIRNQLESWQARLTAQAGDWEAQRDILLAECQAREQTADRHIVIVGALRRRWFRRCRQELTRLRQDSARLATLRREYTHLRETWLLRTRESMSEQRQSASKALALEQYRLELIVQSPAPARAERRVRQLRRQAVEMFAAQEERLTHEERRLHDELASIEASAHRCELNADALAVRQGALTRRETAWEHRMALARSEYEKMKQELRHALSCREIEQRQIKELKEEVERMAQLLLTDTGPESTVHHRAA
jgi:hypothetical protein